MRVGAAALALLTTLGCTGPPEAPPPEAPPPERRAPSEDAAPGRALLAHYECSRCHDGTGLPDPPPEKRCVGCHRDVAAARIEAPPELVDRWRENLHSLPDAPSLDGAARFDASWLAAFFREPHELRPGLEASMPRLAIPEADARALAAALTARAPEVPPETLGDPARGRRLLEDRPCGACHTLGGAPIPHADAEATEPAAARLAPDLAHAGRRMRPEVLIAWLEDPASVFAATPMPPTGLTRAEARDVAAYLVEARPAPPREPPARSSVLDREVRYDEVESSLFRRVCWHCHADPSYALGDGGPGNTGGFGFAPRGLDLATYEAVRSGALDDEGHRRSIFREVELDGELMPLVVAVLRARQLEEAGRPVEGIRGMPLGLPSATPEQIQLLETWIAAGRPR